MEGLKRERSIRECGVEGGSVIQNGSLYSFSTSKTTSFLSSKGATSSTFIFTTKFYRRNAKYIRNRNTLYMDT